MPDVKRFRDAEGGHVITQAPNVLTGPGKKGKVGRKVPTTFEPFPSHISEDYNIQKKLARKALEEHHSLL